MSTFEWFGCENAAEIGLVGKGGRDLVPRYRLKDAQFGSFNIQAEKVHCRKVQGREKGEDGKALCVDHSSESKKRPQSTLDHT